MTTRIGVVGGGIVGLAVARELLLRHPQAEVTVLEKERAVGLHQTSHNSGVVHAGVYYRPGSLKATLCRTGGALLRRYCAERSVPFRECGKLIVAADDDEADRLRGIRDRARANGLAGLALLDQPGIREIEPHARGVLGLHSPTTAVVDFHRVALALAGDVTSAGGHVRCGTGVDDVRQRGPAVLVTTTAGEWAFDRLVVCAGLQGDRVATLAGDGADPRIIPFRGEYFHLPRERRHLVNALIYPVPDPTAPFLGIHFTRHIDGTVSVGPNAVLALAREGYRRRHVRTRDVADIVTWPGFRRMARSYWSTGATEMLGSASRRWYLRQARRYLPELELGDLGEPGSGVRAQAVDEQGRLVDDFAVHRVGAVTAVRNAPSPAATSSLAIAAHLCDEYLDDLPGRRHGPAR